jgi:hypothetical protein
MPAGRILVPIVSLLVRYILWVMEILAKTPLPALYTRNFMISAWLVFSTDYGGYPVFPGRQKEAADDLRAVSACAFDGSAADENRVCSNRS